MSLRGWSAVAAAVLVLAACEELGNPVSGGWVETPWTRWEGSRVVLQTRTTTAPADQADRLLRVVPRELLYHVDQSAPADGVVTLVTVQPSWSSPAGVPMLGVVTELELSGGHVERRFWSVPARAAEWHALLGLPSAPRSAVTMVPR